MKKRELLDLTVSGTAFGGESFAFSDENKVLFKGGIPGQKVRILIKKIRKNKIEGKILSVLEKSPLETEAVCDHFGICGGCSMLSVPYLKQVEIKREQLASLFCEHGHDELADIQVLPCTDTQYKNKMEFTFGNETKDAPLSLGMHMKNRQNSVTTVNTCMLIDEDYRKILNATVDYFSDKELPFYKILSHEGYLRHLVVRKGHNTDEILVNLVTTSQIDFPLQEYADSLLSLETSANIVGILHTINDSFSDAVLCDSLEILYGRDYYYEELLGTKFKISPFSFFQTNTDGAEVLYSQVQALLENAENKLLFDLYSGTGTIGILSARKVQQVVGIELIPEAVASANENIILNDLHNIRYICGDVKDTVKELSLQPDIIILDPPRSGMHTKAIEDVISFHSDEIIYISCNPKALAVELNKFKAAGYEVTQAVGIDQFPNTPHVECVVSMSKVKKMG